MIEIGQTGRNLIGTLFTEIRLHAEPSPCCPLFSQLSAAELAPLQRLGGVGLCGNVHRFVD